ncbi:MAG: IMP dehydrogenase [Candidatus Aenigmatarchaeota archaeon]
MRAGKVRMDEALTFDDVLLLPAESEVLPSDVDIRTHLTKSLKLNIPIISAAMDTVTESGLAIALAREGGIGIIHKNMTKDAQGAEVKKVKKSESWMIKEPVTVTPDLTLRKVMEIKEKLGISSFPVLSGGRLVGMLCNRDIRFEKDPKKEVLEMMTKDPITGEEGIGMEKALGIMAKRKIETLPIVDGNGILKGLITVTDIEKRRKYPRAAKDGEGRLLVGGAIGPLDLERAKVLYDNGADVILVDSAHGHSKNVMDCVRELKKRFDVAVVAGNVATAAGTESLIAAGADAVKVGIGAGSICTTRIVAGVGVPQVSAVMNCAEAAEAHGIPIISDGGARYSGDIAKAIASGASCVMLGSMLAGTDESPGRIVFVQGRKFKTYRGMGSVNAMRMGSADRYFQEGQAKKLVPEGIEGIVPYRGTVSEIVYQMIGGLRSSMGYCGCKDIDEMMKKTVMRRITKAGVIESHPHDVMITEEAPNYWKVG